MEPESSIPMKCNPLVVTDDLFGNLSVNCLVVVERTDIEVQKARGDRQSQQQDQVEILLQNMRDVPVA